MADSSTDGFIKLLTKQVKYEQRQAIYAENPWGLEANTLITEHLLKYNFSLAITDDGIAMVSDYFTTEGQYDMYFTGYVLAKESLKEFMADALPIPNTYSNMFHGLGSYGLKPKEHRMEVTLRYLIQNEDCIQQALERAFHSILLIRHRRSGEVFYRVDLEDSLNM